MGIQKVKLNIHNHVEILFMIECINLSNILVCTWTPPDTSKIFSTIDTKENERTTINL